MKKKYTNLMLIVSIVMALITISAFIFIFKVIENKNKHASKVLITLADKMAEKENAKLLAKKVTELGIVHENINNYFIDPSKIDTFVDYLEKLGIENKTDLSIKNIEAREKEQNIITFEVLVSGSFNDVMKVVYLLENIPYNVSLNQVFINENTKKIEEEVKGIKKETIISNWQADIIFNILNLPK